MGMMLFDTIWSQKIHSPWNNELLCVVDGQVTIRMQRSRIVAGPGDVILLPEDTHHRDDFDLTVGLRVFMVYFFWDTIQDYRRVVSPMEFFKRAAEIRNELAPFVDELQCDRGGGTHWGQFAASAWVLAILMRVWRASRQARCGTKEHPSEKYGQRRHGELIQRAKQYLNEHYCEPVSLDRMAKALRISPFYLSRLFAKESGFSMTTYLTGRRMHQARRLLLDGRHNVSETAYAIGYNNITYFSKLFRRYFGYPPTDIACPALMLPPFPTSRPKSHRPAAKSK